MNIRFTRDALADIENIHAHLARRQSAAYAHQVAATIKVAINRLAEFPNLGRAGRVAGTRELVVARTAYVVPYVVRDNMVVIQRVLHASQQWPPDDEDQP